MKPTKNRVYCKDCGRHKMLFETEKKAYVFIKFNSEEIESDSGYSPIRSYYCMFCNGWHVTSSTEHINIKSKTEIVLDLYNQDREKRAKIAEIKKNKTEILNKHLKNVERQIEILDAIKVYGNLNRLNENLKIAFKELEIAKSIDGSKNRKINIEDKLIKLQKEIEISTK